jgi:ubiquinone/menaquinone biosynthesis C-methylase UbiE
MTGVKLGDRVLIVGVRDIALIAALATKSGLTGQACAIDADAERVRTAGPAIEREGALVEVTRAPWGMLPFDEGSFDIAVVRDVLMALPADARSLAAGELLRVLRPGGRAIVIETAPRGGFGALFNTVEIDSTYLSSGGAQKALTRAGFGAVRQLAERDGLAYFEGIKSPRTGQVPAAVD